MVTPPSIDDPSKVVDAEIVTKKPLKPWLFQPGNKASGSRLGVRSRYSNKVMTELLKDFEMHGAETIARCRTTDPSAYLRVIASLIPKELKIKEGSSALDSILDQFNSEQLNSVINALADRGVREESEEHQTTAIARIESDSFY
jgi:hypothetical protein